MFSAYLVGTWERRFGVRTTLQIVNPTLDDLEVVVAFLDDNENFVHCIRSEEALSPNDMWEIIVPDLNPLFGVVKIISYKKEGEEDKEEAQPGIVGFQRHILAVPRPAEIAFSEAPLAAIPMQYAQPELERILDHCR